MIKKDFLWLQKIDTVTLSDLFSSFKLFSWEKQPLSPPENQMVCP